MKITELPIKRRQIFDKCMKIESIEELLSIQEEIANAIRRCERELAKDQHRDVLRFHISRLRLYVDGLVWLVLHPHTIRQMANNPSPLPSIESQGEAFDRVLESARAFVEQYQVPVFVADITNILGVGDLVVCASHEVPIIVECKTRLPQPKHLMQGRIGRQVSRAMGTLEYLTEGAVKLFGEDKHRQVVETPHIAQRNWEIITSICQTARNDGRASCQVSEYEVFWAYTCEHLDSVGDEMKAYADQDEEVFLGTSAGLMNRIGWSLSFPYCMAYSNRIKVFIVGRRDYRCSLG